MVKVKDKDGKEEGKPESGESGSRKTVVWEPASHGEGTEVERADERLDNLWSMRELIILLSST